MTLQKARVIDWLGKEKGSGHVLLTLVDEMDWSNERDHLLRLQEKLNTYLVFIESGEVFERLAEELGENVPRDTPVKVSILAKFQPSENAKAFLEYARGEFASAGCSLTFKVVHTH